MGGGEGSTPASEAPNPSETQGGANWTGKAQTQDNPLFCQGGDDISTSFSQNPKQVLVASDSWYDSSKVFRHQRHLLYCERG